MVADTPIPALAAASSSDFEPRRLSGAPKPTVYAPPAARTPTSGRPIAAPTASERAIAGTRAPAPIGSNVQASPVSHLQARTIASDIGARP